MDDGGHRENGRQKVDQYKAIHTQWMMPQHQMKDNNGVKFMTIVAERDKAIQERNLALSEKKVALAERDMAILQRDAAIAERNTALMERDNALATLEYARGNGMTGNSGPPCPHMSKHMHNHQQQQHLQNVHPQPSQLSEGQYNHTRGMVISEAYPISDVSGDSMKARKAKRHKDTKTQPTLKAPNTPRKKKGGGDEDLNRQVKMARPHGEWKVEVDDGDDLNKQASEMKYHEWKEQDLGLNQIAFDESTMPIPVCSCTGKYQQCYKWGNGGWQSACCTTTLSMYPLPVMPNKRHARLGGRKMSGSAFHKLLSRLSAEGHDLSVPLDLKDHWAKHGTNRYITVK